MWGKKVESIYIDNFFKKCCYKGDRRHVTVDGGARECLYAIITQRKTEMGVAERGE